MDNIAISAALGLAFDIGHIREYKCIDHDKRFVPEDLQQRYSDYLCCFLYTRFPDKYIKYRHVLHSKDGDFITGNPESCRLKSYEFEGICGEKYMIPWNGFYLNEKGNPLVEILKIKESDGSDCIKKICCLELDEKSILPADKEDILEDDSICYPRLEQDKKDLKNGKELYSGPMFHRQ